MRFSDDAALQAAAAIVAAQIAKDDRGGDMPGNEISERLYKAFAAVRAVDFALTADRSATSMEIWKKLAEDIPR